MAEMDVLPAGGEPTEQKPTIEELEKAIGTPDEMDILPDGSTQPKHKTTITGNVEPEIALRARRIEEALSAVKQIIVEDLLSVPPKLSVHLPTIRGVLKELLNRERRPIIEACVGSEDFKEDCFALRARIEETKHQTMLVFREHPVFTAEHSLKPPIESGEMKANLILAFRHLENASMRLGKAIQAFDGGKSCYPQ